MPYTVISLGGIAVGFAVIAAFVVRWWLKEGRSWIALIPFVFALLYGMLAAISAYNSVSALGAVAWLAIWAGNLAGYVGLVWGVGGTDRNVTRAVPIAIEPGGYVILFLLTVVFVCLLAWGGKKIPRGKLAAGALAGALLALSGTVAGIAAIPLGSATNAAGAIFTSYF
jgi:hypothetical protein